MHIAIDIALFDPEFAQAVCECVMIKPIQYRDTQGRDIVIKGHGNAILEYVFSTIPMESDFRYCMGCASTCLS